MNTVNLKNALISVYDKAGIEDFADELVELGWTIYASGGTARTLVEYGIPVIDIRTLVGEPILGHRVVTLSREISAGLLARKDVGEDMERLADLGLPYFDLVCVDTYPLRKAVEAKAPVGELIELTDIGGPTLLRAAAKGNRLVICDRDDRAPLLAWLRDGERFDAQMRATLAASAEAFCAQYALASSNAREPGSFHGLIGSHVRPLKYGENAWQTPAAQYALEGDDPLALHRFKRVQGDAGFVNLTDVDRLLLTVTHIAAGFEANGLHVPFIAVGVKHGNPCGAAVSDSRGEALKEMIDGDRRAIFGGVVMATCRIDADHAEILLRHGMEKGRRHLAVLVAPSISPQALELLQKKSDPQVAVFTNEALASIGVASLDVAPRLRPVRGGFLLQPNYTKPLDLKSLSLHGPAEIRVQPRPSDLLPAWAVGCTSNSNTVTLVKDGMLIGNGVGQQDRVGAAELAIKRARDAGHDVLNATAYSDSFFPFPDGPQALILAGVRTILTTSGSVRDPETIRVCQEAGVNLMMMPDKEGRGFFGH